MSSQSPTENRRWVLAGRPAGEPAPDNFRLETAPVPEPGAGQMLLRTLYLSLDPYMRGRMDAGPSYAARVEIGTPMGCHTVSQVVASNLDGFAPGELVIAYGQWQDYNLWEADPVFPLFKVTPGTKPTWGLGALGMPGFAGWYGLTQIGQPKAGETVVVAAATGGVGAMVGQVAKARGCRAVGIAGGPEKCAFAVTALGFDACIDHKAADFPQQLAAACPDGVDIYFENVGGKVLTAVLPLLNPYARIPLCGVISRYGAAQEQGPDQSVPLMTAFLTKRVTLRGYIIFEHYDQFDAFVSEALPLLQTGALHYREDIVEGLENAPEAFIGLLKGENFGKLMVKVADPV